MSIQVSVLCIVYNHERYIRKCLESLIGQETNFEYEIIVHDDASTDNSQTIIREYSKKNPELIRTVLQADNKYSQGIPIVARYLLPTARGKYIAICEGDDFWTDSNKLQLQYDIMEKNPDYSMCCHAAYYAYENGTLDSDHYFAPYNISKIIPFESILEGWLVATNSIFYRKRIIEKENYEIPFRKDCPNGDYALAVFFGLKGNVYYINKLMSAYRKVSVGSLGWTYSGDPALTKKAKTKLIEMLDRINSYTNKQYDNIIESYKKKLLFEICLATGDIRTAKKYSSLYNNLKRKEKIVLYVRSFFPRLLPQISKFRKKHKLYFGMKHIK